MALGIDICTSKKFLSEGERLQEWRLAEKRLKGRALLGANESFPLNEFSESSGRPKTQRCAAYDFHTASCGKETLDERENDVQTARHENDLCFEVIANPTESPKTEAMQSMFTLRVLELKV